MRISLSSFDWLCFAIDCWKRGKEPAMWLALFNSTDWDYPDWYRAEYLE